MYNLLECFFFVIYSVKGLNPKVISLVGWVWSSGWTYSCCCWPWLTFRQPVRLSCSESKWVVSCQLMVLISGYLPDFGQLSRDVIGRLSVKLWCYPIQDYVHPDDHTQPTYVIYQSVEFNRPFYRYGIYLNLLDLRSIMGCPGGIRSVFSALPGQKENFTVYFSRIKRSLLHPNTAERSFFPITIFFLKKNWPVKRA